jgi:hypothetical protein
MRVHHKTPTLVSMWMLDVFCCALGCVTLLWLLNNKQAGAKVEELNDARSALAAARAEIDTTKLTLTADLRRLTDLLRAAETDRDETAARLGVAEGEAKAARAQFDRTRDELTKTEAKRAASAAELAKVREAVAAADDALRKKQKEADALSTKLTAATTSAEELRKLVREKDEAMAAVEKRAAGLKKMLDDADARLAATEKDLTKTGADAKAAAAKAAQDLAAARAAAAKTAEELAAAKATRKKTDEELAAVKTAVKKAEAELAAARGEAKTATEKYDAALTRLILLEKEREKAATAAKSASESKFAGIAMTGRRVVFLVDMSGSMEKTDPRTVAPDKWPTVAETVAKVMRTIPTLEEYQVIMFSTEAWWLAGGSNWQKYEGEKTAKEVEQKIRGVKPEGDTNLYTAFDLAFSLRARGLDTIYLFSDGLPTSGPGLTAAEAADPNLRELDRSEKLARYLRQKLAADWNRRPPAGERVRIHAVGFFYESPDLGSFLWALARENDGSFVGMSRP